MVANATLRYPGEWFNLILAAIIGSIIFVILSFLTGGFCCLWGFIGLIFVLLMVGAANNHLKVLGLAIDEEKEPRIYSLSKESCNSLGVKMPSIFIDSSQEVNAFTRGMISPIVVLNKGLVDIMNDGELKFVIGHELGHIKLFHFTIRTLFDSSIIRVPLLAYIPLMIFKVLFLNGRMSRSFEHSADRAGLHACNSIEDAVSCMIKLKTGQKRIDDSKVKQAIAGNLDIDGDDSFLRELFSSHPDFEDRVGEMVKYSETNGVGWA